MRDVIATKEGPQAIGPYSQAIRANGFVFVSGQVAIDPATQQVITGDVAAQTERVIKNLSAILTAAGSGLKKAVRTTIFLEYGRLHCHERIRTIFQRRPASQIDGRSISPAQRCPG